MERVGPHAALIHECQEQSSQVENLLIDQALVRASLVARAVKNLPAMQEDQGLIPGLGRFPRRRKWQLTPVFLPGESHGQRSLVGYSPWGHKAGNWPKRTPERFELEKYTKSQSLG